MEAQARASRRTARGAEATRERARLQADLESLYEGEKWEEIAALYFKARFVVTGDDVFQLTQSQKKLLGETLATTMKVLLQIDPKYVAIIIFGVNFGSIIVEKETAYRSKKKSAHVIPMRERGDAPRS